MPYSNEPVTFPVTRKTLVEVAELVQAIQRKFGLCDKGADE